MIRADKAVFLTKYMIVDFESGDDQWMGGWGLEPDCMCEQYSIWG